VENFGRQFWRDGLPADGLLAFLIFIGLQCFVVNAGLVLTTE
jgi:hypothetical protein